MARYREKTKVQCPECGQWFFPQGLHGHLRTQHKKRLPLKAHPSVLSKPMPVLMSAELLEESVVKWFDGQTLKDTEGVVVGTFKVAQGARVATLINLEGKPVATLEVSKGEAEKALLSFKE